VASDLLDTRAEDIHMLSRSHQAVPVFALDLGVKIRDARRQRIGALFPELDPGRLAFVLTAGDEQGAMAFAREPFDSEVFGLEIGRIAGARASSAEQYRCLFEAVLCRARMAGYGQVLRRTAVSNLAEIWGLEGAGFELMDVGVTFAQRVAPGTREAVSYSDLHVGLSTDADIEAIARDMVLEPWASRYEADPAYAPDRVRELRSRWLTNLHRGRAQAFFVGRMDGQPAGYVTCTVDGRTGIGDIELVGTMPAFRGRRVASRVLEHALWWFSTRTPQVTVRTQATNIGAATLYERAGFTLHSSDLTFRAAIRPSHSGSV
jgi:ribosomal protein S18 acetylase RimI-like enzyme